MTRSTIQSILTLICMSSAFAAVVCALVGFGSVVTVVLTGVFLASSLAALAVNPRAFRREFDRLSSELEPEQLVRR